MQRLDAEKLSSQLDIECHKKIMLSLGGIIKSENDKQVIWYTNVCHGGDSPKLFFFKEIKMYVCYTNCGSLNIYKLVMKAKGFNFPQALEYCAEICHIPYEKATRITKRDDSNIDNWKASLERYMRYKQADTVLKVFDKSILEFLDRGFHESWIKHGISEEVMKAYNIGWYDVQNCITIPVFSSENDLVGIRCRNIDPVSVANGFKYLPLIMLNGFSYAFPSSCILYGQQFNESAIRLSKQVLLTESEKGVLKLATWFGMENCNALGMYGSALSKHNRDYILSLGVQEVVIVADRDYKSFDDEEYEAWEKKMFKLASLFKGFCKVTILYDKEFKLGYKDNCTDGDLDYFKEMYENREIAIDN